MSEPYLPPEDVGSSAGRRERGQETEAGDFFVRIGKLFVAGTIFELASSSQQAQDGGWTAVDADKKPKRLLCCCTTTAVEMWCLLYIFSSMYGGGRRTWLLLCTTAAVSMRRDRMMRYCTQYKIQINMHVDGAALLTDQRIS